MKTASDYRGARRNEAREKGFPWRFLDLTASGREGQETVTVDHPFKRGGKPAALDALLAARRNAIASAPPDPRPDGKRFGFGELRRLRAERGVGPVSRIDEAKRATFASTKRG